MSTKEVHKIEVKGARKVRKFSLPIGLNLVWLALGICLVIFADQVTSLISILIGATFLTYAAYNYIAYFRVENRNASDVPKLITAIALSIAGAFLIINNGFIKEAISIAVGLIILIASIFRMQDALASKKYNPNYNNSLILSLIGIVCGALCVFGKIIIPNLAVQVIGILLIIFAFVDATGGIMVTKSAKKVHAKVIDSE